MPDDLQSLCDLVELRAAKDHTPLARLWERVFAAIRDGQLDFGFPDEFKSEYGSLKHRIPLPRPWAPEDHVTEIETLCTSALSAIENGDAFPPWGQLWVRRMLVSAAAFDRALFPARFEPHEQSPPRAVANSTRDNKSALAAAIKKRLSAGENPAATVPWDQFCDAVRDDTNGWVDRKQRKFKWGYGDKTIKRIVKQVERDKRDK